MNFNTENISETTLKELYLNLLKPRLIEEKMLIALRQGKISKWFSAWGQEAISVGCTSALLPNEYICTLHRNLGIFTTRGVPFSRLFSQFSGKANGFTQGRDRSFHFGSHEYKTIGMISHLGSQMGVADGIALANILSKNKEITLVFTGDGGASEGDFHEAINVAAVWQLPVVIVVENNQWGLSTPSSEQFRMKSFADKGIGYGIEAKTIDGNNILEVYSTIHSWAEELRQNPRPVLIECNTFRIRGHEEASGTAYYPEGIIEKWESKDPLHQYEQFLKAQNFILKEEVERLKISISQEIDIAFEKTLEEAEIIPNTEKEIHEIFAPSINKETSPTTLPSDDIRFVDAISDALKIALERHEKLIFMGQDIAEYGGAFKVTQGLYEQFGKDRIRNTPICEAAIVGAALGLSIKGMPSMVEMQFADFVTEAFNQIVNNLAKVHYRWGQNANVVIRMPTGGGMAAGPFHSQSNEAWFTKVPGLKILYPSSAYDAKGLLLQAFEDPNPVLFFEHKKMYRSVKGKVPNGYYSLPIGKANYIQKGNDLSIITYGMGVEWAKIAVKNAPNISAEIVDLRSLQPIDYDLIFESVKKTGKVLILHEDTLTCGIGAELSARIAEECFEDLDAPIMRVGSLDTPIPFAKSLEDNFLANNYLMDKLNKLFRY